MELADSAALPHNGVSLAWAHTLAVLALGSKPAMPSGLAYPLEVIMSRRSRIQS